MSDTDSLAYAAKMQDQRDTLARTVFLLLLGANKTPEQARADISALTGMSADCVIGLTGRVVHHVE